MNDSGPAMTWRHWLLIGLMAVVPASVYLGGDSLRATYPEWPAQWPSYYQFADGRAWGRVPNAGDVLSNLPFLFVGAYGLWLVGSLRLREQGPLRVPWERIAWLVLCLGILTTGLGSGYFHWAPGHATLFWDRLPMAITFGGLVSIFLGERISPRWGRRLLWPVTLLACGSVVYWHITEQRGHGDLRPYAVVQFGCVLLVAFSLLLFRSPYTKNGAWWWVILCYALAKVLEDRDGVVFRLTQGVVSGHTLKHLAAAASTGGMVWHLRWRQRA